jgi:hypothetical protein
MMVRHRRTISRHQACRQLLAHAGACAQQRTLATDAGKDAVLPAEPSVD